MRPRQARTRLLLTALLLLMQWLGAPAHALSMARAMAAEPGLALLICGPDGLHEVTLDASGRPGQDAPKAKPPADCCDLCLQAQTGGLPPPALLGPALRWVTLRPAAGPARFCLAVPRAPPQQPRAPPAAF
jgi:hypothetical protein